MQIIIFCNFKQFCTAEILFFLKDLIFLKSILLINWHLFVAALYLFYFLPMFFRKIAPVLMLDYLLYVTDTK